MTRHVVCVDTAKNLLIAKNGQTWRQFAVALEYDENYFATLNAASRRIPGAMSRGAEKELRERLGIASPPTVKVHRPYITDEAKWQAYLAWSAEYDAAQAKAQRDTLRKAQR